MQGLDDSPAPRLGGTITCKHCKHAFVLTKEDVDIDLCCDGECEFDQSEDEVLKWCALQREGSSLLTKVQNIFRDE